MAIRTILPQTEPTLHKVCRPVTEFNEHLWRNLEDMKDTLHAAQGVGLAAPQIGILRRYFVIDTGEKMVEIINPVIAEEEGVQEEIEGCLSCPGEYGITRRPKRVKIKGQDRNGQPIEVEGEDIIARGLCHETDHLDGILFKVHVVREVPEEK
ncbi:MAG: peptide deformylase [Oscillospiraceae bacterium]|nr:peptide deformylase [Oscillospiraceae bacterium]